MHAQSRGCSRERAGSRRGTGWEKGLCDPGTLLGCSITGELIEQEVVEWEARWHLFLGEGMGEEGGAGTDGVWLAKS